VCARACAVRLWFISLCHQYFILYWI